MIPANMTLEVSELFSRELTRVIIIASSCIIVLSFIQKNRLVVVPALCELFTLWLKKAPSSTVWNLIILLIPTCLDAFFLCEVLAKKGS